MISMNSLRRTIDDTNAYLVTFSLAGYQFHHSDGSVVRVDDSEGGHSKSQLIELGVPFVDFTTVPLQNHDVISDMPGPTTLIRPPPYSVTDMAPVDLFASIAAESGAKVYNCKIFTPTTPFLRSLGTPPPSNPQNLNRYQLDQRALHSETQPLNEWANKMIRLAGQLLPDIPGSVDPLRLRDYPSTTPDTLRRAKVHIIAGGIARYSSSLNAIGHIEPEEAWALTFEQLKAWEVKQTVPGKRGKPLSGEAKEPIGDSIAQLYSQLSASLSRALLSAGKSGLSPGR